MKTFVGAAGALVALGLFAVAGSAQAVTVIPLTPVFPGTITGTTDLTPHETVEYEFTIPAPDSFVFSFTDGISFSTSGQSGIYKETFTNGATSSTGGYTLTTAVPEPASWALMIAGFGGIGAITRRRKTVASA